MSSWRYRTLVPISLVLGALVSYAWLHRPVRQPVANIHSNAGKMERLFRPITERESNYYQFDPEIGLLHKPHASRTFDWPEHPQGHVTQKTNNLGFRNDTDTDLEVPLEKKKSSKRILIVGDSHTDGVVYNSESFSHQLEVLLKQAKPEFSFEVLNGGVGYYSFYNYEAAVRNFLKLKPNLVVVAVYSGNDYMEAAAVLETENPLKRPDDYFTRLTKVSSKFSGPLSQEFNEIYYFKNFPAMKDKVLSFAQTKLSSIQKMVKETNAQLIVVILPSKAEVEWQSDAENLNELTRQLELTRQDLAVPAELNQRLIDWMKKEGISSLNAADGMRDPSKKYYWNLDYHLSIDGHKAVAELLLKNSQAVF